MMLDLKSLNADPRRWLCTECDAEGRGRIPSCCPCYGGERWYASVGNGKDPRRMVDVFWEVMETVETLRAQGKLH